MSETILFFNNRNEFRKWLEKNNGQKESVWVELLKKDKTALTHNEALEEVLCYGWIDSIIKRVDEKKYKIKFSPRRKKSKWSEVNKAIVAKLIQSGKMTKYGLAAIEEAKKNGNWYKDITPVISSEMIDLLREKIIKETLLLSSFDKLRESDKKTFAFYYSDAKKEETKEKRFKIILEHITKEKRLL